MEGTERKSVRMVRGGFVAALAGAVALPLLVGTPVWIPDGGLGRTWSSGGLSGLAERPLAPVAMPLTVRLTSIVSSASARIGSPWTGIVVRPLALGPRRLIPAGTAVRGVVTAAGETGPDGRAMLELAVQDLTIGGRSRRLAAWTGAFVAGAPRARYRVRLGARGDDDEVVLKPRTVMVFALDERLASR
jgi:hypothetical protein